MRIHIRRAFDDSFKQNAVQITLKGDRTIRQVADPFDITERLLHTWSRRYAPIQAGAVGTKSDLSPEQKDEDIVRLRGEIVRVRESPPERCC